MFWIDISRWMIRSRCRWISVYLPWRTAHAFEPLLFVCSQLPSCNLFTLHSLFIVFWERDITSEHHGNLVHTSTIVYTFNLLSAFTFSCIHHYHYLLCLILCKQQGRRD